MDPISTGTMVALGAGGLQAASSIYQGHASSDAMYAQAAADQERANLNAEWDNLRAGDELAAGQRAAFEERRKADLAKSRLTALAGASGSSASDPGATGLLEDIEAEGQANAGTAMATGKQKAEGIEYQAALDRWTADRNARIKRSSARSTMLGGYLTGAGQIGSAMAARYAMPTATSARTGYGGR